MRRQGWAAIMLLLWVGYQTLVHSAVAGAQPEPVRLGLTVLPLLALSWWVALRCRHQPLWLLVLAAAATATYLMADSDAWGLAAAYGIPHAAIYLFLLWLFGHTLLPQQEPLITRLARRVHGVMPPDLQTYTRRLTAAWCGFFAAQLAISALLFEFGSPVSWSLFINLMNFPLLVLMFGAEYLYRITFHPGFPRASVATAIQAFVADAAPGGNTDVR